MTYALRYPFRLDGLGRPVATTDAGEIWKDRAMILLSTLIGERPGDLFYGAEMAQAAFMPVDLIKTEIVNAVQTAFTRYMANIEIHTIEVDTSNATLGYVGVSITFSIPEGQTVEVSSVVDLAIIGLG